jgi:hypothetical protein
VPERASRGAGSAAARAAAIAACIALSLTDRPIFAQTTLGAPQAAPKPDPGTDAHQAAKSAAVKTAREAKAVKAKGKGGKAAAESDDTVVDDDGVVPGRGKRSCPPGQVPAPGRGRGGDGGGCI